MAAPSRAISILPPATPQPLTLLQTAAGGATGNAVISATITGAGGAPTDASLTITTDTGYSVSLGGTNTYSGGTAVTAGTLVVSNNSALGTGALTLDPGTTVNLAGVSIANTIDVSGDPNITVTGASAINTISGTGHRQHFGYIRLCHHGRTHRERAELIYRRDGGRRRYDRARRDSVGRRDEFLQRKFGNDGDREQYSRPRWLCRGHWFRDGQRHGDQQRRRRRQRF